MIQTTATNKKVRELLKATRDGALVPRPEFQRRLVWTSKDKDRFIETVLKGYPFPEIYICNGEIDVETGDGTQLLVDGLQRVSTLSEYFLGEPGISHVASVPYAQLLPEEKQKFLEYNVVVRDLGALSKDQIIEVFRRLNSTQYTLRDMEVHNAIYDGEMKKFCERFSESSFFDDHRVFLASDRKRMGDVSFCLSIVATMMNGYFNRDADHESILNKYNESFPEEATYQYRIDRILNFIEECGFDHRSRIWKKADFFSAFIELDSVFQLPTAHPEPRFVLTTLEKFYADVESEAPRRRGTADIYYKSALQASNDRTSRIRRGMIIGGKLISAREEEILEQLAAMGLI
ncbi:MAG: DUF262 domain-containing protein [Pseudotabrizicola sp.]|uniref:DUF262 domain-containing protein n=1 Tax=Pseudotabrizicola sp. TaxID=2939647 RepID=UPI0027226318|nr:DUF262 domain-containing protein [Pseudotabrizicola sp.]MDO9638986.1 DUF262 domain-containing protein [Pseudotabrizicola sp.]